MPKSLWLGWSIALLSTAASSILSVVAKVTVDLGLDSAIVLTLRLLIATALLTLTILFTRPAQLRIDGRGLLICLCVGAFVGFGQLTYFTALKDMSSSVAAMLFSLYPLAVLVLLALRGETFTARRWLRLALGLTGVYWLIGVEGHVGWWGVVRVFISVLGFAVLTVSIQWFLQGYDAMTVTLYTVAGMGLANVIGWAAQGTAWKDPGLLGWFTILVLAVAVTYIGRLTYFHAIRHIGGGQTALLMPVEILLSVFWSFVFLSERLAPAQGFGAALILVSASLAIERWPLARAVAPAVSTD